MHCKIMLKMFYLLRFLQEAVSCPVFIILVHTVLKIHVADSRCKQIFFLEHCDSVDILLYGMTQNDCMCVSIRVMSYEKALCEYQLFLPFNIRIVHFCCIVFDKNLICYGLRAYNLFSLVYLYFS